MEEGLEKYGLEVEVHQQFSQILLRTNSCFTLKMARDLIGRLNIEILGVNPILTNILIFKLNVKDARDVALKLVEHGFWNIKGYNASSFKT